MEFLNYDSHTSFLIFSAACLFVGVFFGISLSAFGIKKRIKKAVEKVKNEAEQEKLEISRDLNTQLVQVKESIVKTVEAYSAVAKTIQEKLPIPPEFQALYSKDTHALRLEVTPSPEEKAEEKATEEKITEDTSEYKDEENSENEEDEKQENPDIAAT